MIKNIHIRQSHTLQALIQTGDQIFSAAKITVRSFPHIIACLGTDDQFIPVGIHFFPQDPSQITLCASRYRSVIIGKIKVGNTMIKGCKTHLLHILVIIIRTKIMPEPQRKGRKLQSTPSTSSIKACIIIFLISCFTCSIFSHCSISSLVNSIVLPVPLFYTC